MTAVQLFLNLKYNSPADGSNSIEEILKSLAGIEQVMQVRSDQASEAKLELHFDPHRTSLSDIETMIQNNGVSVTSVFVHFSGMITGMNDPYSASAKSFPLEKSIGAIEGINSVSTSPAGEVKIEMAPEFTNKDTVIKHIIEILSEAKNGKDV
jgi:hypothetical protein